MNSYYTGKRAQHYTIRWRTYTRCTLAEVLAMIDFAALRNVPERLERSPRLLDVACGTGITSRCLWEIIHCRLVVAWLGAVRIEQERLSL